MKKSLLVGLALASFTSYSQITITPGGGVAAISSSLFGAGVTISGVTLNCNAAAYGTFSGNLGASGMSTGGVVLTTGSAAQADGPNNTGGAACSVANTTTGDPILAAAQPLPSGYQYLDACILEFNLVPQCSTLSINFCFASEEYLEYVSSNYNDGFGIFVNGPNPLGGSYTNYNMARLPGGQVVSIDNVNSVTNSAYYNNSPAGAAAIMQYDGYTDGLVATLNVVPCQTYTFHITICDARDQAWDSGVFLQFQGLYCSVPSLAATMTSIPTTCGGNNGSATATVTAGTAPISYAWTNAGGAPMGTTSTITGLAAGTYTVTISDGSPCTPDLVQSVTVGGSTGPTVTPVAETCNGYNDGQVTINNAVGAGPYTVTINGPGGFTQTVIEANTAAAVAAFTGLPDGNFTYTVTGSGGCSNNGTFTIGAGPMCCSVTASGTNVTCFGGTTGSVTANPTGLPGFTYSWNSTPVQITQTASGLPSGTYTVIMTDNSGCTATANVTITQPTQINATTVNVNPLCNGGSTGSITVNASGGTGALQYSLNGGAYQASNVFNTLAAGTYTITVRDANGCTRNFTATLTNPPAVAIALVSTAPATCGSSNGSITVSGSGGTGAYTFSNGGAFGASGTFTGLAAGTYTMTVRDANNCTATLTATVTSSAGPVASILSQTNLNCFGGANGSVLIGATGGTPTIQYSIDLAGPTPATPFQTSNSFTGLVAGVYTVTIRDANNCTGTTTFTITAPTQLTYTSVASPATCNGVCDGSIDINPSGGTAPYQYSSNSGLSFGTVEPMTGLCAGNINVVVRDANGCLANSIVPITQPAAITATYTLTNPVCPDICNGQVQVNTPAGGTSPYQYSANGGGFQLSGLLTGLCDGPNSIVVRDAHGCLLTTTQNLVDPPSFTINEISNNPSNCLAFNGSFEVAATGGFAPYTYNNITLGIVQVGSGAFGSLQAGGYNIEVTDNHGCVQNLFVGVNDVEMDGILDGVIDATCNGSCDGQVMSHALLGAPPIQFELDLDGVFEPDGDFTALCAGSHIVTIIDNGNCIFTLPFTVVEPDEIMFTTAVTNVACSGGATGAIVVNPPTGGDGTYQYSINGGPYVASPSFTGLAAGTYTLSVMDGNGCLGSATATVTQAPPITFTTNINNLTCNGNNSGFLQIVATGGTGTLSYSINGGTTFVPGFTFVGQPAGTFNIVVRDNAGCTVTGTATITEPAALTAGYVVSPTLCNGSCDGSITVNASGGTTPYNYSSDNGSTYQLGNLLGGLCAGTYQVAVKDANNCLIGSSQIITQPTLINFTTTLTPSTCGSANGEIDFNMPAGGTPGYTYSIDGGVTFVAGTNFPGLNAGNFDLSVKDANNCVVDASVTIVDMGTPSVTAVFTTDPLCFNDCNGEADVTASGGTGSLEYSIDGGLPQASNVLTGICSGAHTITVTDDNGCTDTENINLVNPAVVAFTASGTNLTCYQDLTGIITVNPPTGGTGVYTYSYDGGTTFTAASVENNLAAGTYTVVVSDGNNCTASTTITITEPAPLAFTSATPTDAVCAGVCDGQIDVVVTGGTGAYTYSWGAGIAGPTDASATGVCVGSYLVIVNDVNNCTIDTTLAVGEPAPVIINGTTVGNVTCNAACDGSISINSPAATQFSAVPTGSPANYGASNTIGSLCAGTYDISVTDAAGCPATTTATVTEPAVLNMTVTPSATVCYNKGFDLFAIATGGTEPYTFNWDNGHVGAGQVVYPTANTNYNVTVTDANGCTFGPLTVTATIIAPLTAVVSPDVTICEGASTTMVATASNGAAPYQYFWQVTPGVVSDSYTVTPTAPTTYTVIAVDVCSDSVQLSVDVDFYTSPAITLVPDNPAGCSPLNVSYTANFGGTFVSTACVWDFGNGDGSTDCAVANTVYTTPGCYDVTITVTSPEGCTFDSTFNDLACVYPDPVVDFTYNPTNPTTLQPEVNFVNLTIGGATFDWDFEGQDSSSLEHPTYNFINFEGGEHIICLSVVSSQGCTGDTCKPITILDETLLYVPNAFTPDGDGVNDIFLPSVSGVRADGYEFYIFDRWGELIFQTTDKLKGWDGQVKGIQAKEDVYVWKMKAKMVTSEDVKEYYGHVTLLK